MGARSETLGDSMLKMEFTKRLAERLGVNHKTAKLIYDTYSVCVLEALAEGYGRVKALDFLFVELRNSPQKKMLDVSTGEEIETTPKAKLYCQITRRSKDWEEACRLIEVYNEQQARRDFYEMQAQKEREEQLRLKEEERKLKEKERSKLKKKMTKRKRKEQTALRRLINAEIIFHESEKDKYQKELRQRQSGK